LNILAQNNSLLFPKSVFSTNIKAFFYQNFYLDIFAVVKILEGTLPGTHSNFRATLEELNG